MNYEAYGRVKGEPNSEWRPILWDGLRYYTDTQGRIQLQQMTQQLASYFQYNEYKIEEVLI